MSGYNSNLTKPLIGLIMQAAQRYSLWDVFTDFLTMSATSISNSVDKIHWDEREKQYMETVKKYSRDELALFPQIFGELMGAMESCVQSGKRIDVLGRVFHELELHNECHGQFFTPQNLADFMGEIALSDHDPTIARRGYLTVCEPACGGGAMVIGVANAMRKHNYNYCTQLVVESTDIDLKCVHMAYIQLSLYGIPAVVRHGNSLTMEEWSRWHTPAFITDGWGLWNYLKDDGKDHDGPDLDLSLVNQTQDIQSIFDLMN